MGAVILAGQALAVIVLAHGSAAAIAWHYDFQWFAAASLLMMLVRMLRRSHFVFRTSFWLPLAIVASFTAVHILYFANGRFLHPMRPWMTMAAGALAAWMVGYLRMTSPVPAPAPPAGEPSATAG